MEANSSSGTGSNILDKLHAGCLKRTSENYRYAKFVRRQRPRLHDVVTGLLAPIRVIATNLVGSTTTAHGVSTPLWIPWPPGGASRVRYSPAANPRPGTSRSRRSPRAAESASLQTHTNAHKPYLPGEATAFRPEPTAVAYYIDMLCWPALRRGGCSAWWFWGRSGRGTAG